MYERHPAFLEPPGSARLWRYMSLPKLVALLQDRALFFTRLDRFGDRFEGTLPTRNFRGGTEDGKALLREIQQHTLINCWHLSRYQSDALWQVYGRHEGSIAIRTSAQRLVDSFSTCEGPVYVGMVYYTDFHFGGVVDQYERFPYLVKRNDFQHEREVRAVIRVTSAPEFGRNVKVDVDRLIDQIFVPPTAQDWFMHTVAKLLDAYNVPRPVRRSRSDPYG